MRMMGTYNSMKLVFKVICCIVTTSMVVFWIMQFQKDEDVSFIEYHDYNTSNDLIYPDISICADIIYNYEEVEKINSTKNLNVSLEDYHNYLIHSNDYKEEYSEISFDDVTIDLLDYVKTIRFRMRDTGQMKILNCTSMHTCPFYHLRNSFIGFWDNRMYKCFGIEIAPNYSKEIKGVYLAFQWKVWRFLNQFDDFEYGDVFVVFNYHQQMLRNPDVVHKLWAVKEDRESLTSIKITAIEILRHRNKYRNPCFENWTHYDHSVFEKHAQRFDCSVPYHTSDKPLCTDENDIRESKYELTQMKRKYYPRPCLELSNVVFTSTNVRDPGELPRLYVSFPDRIKTVTQFKAVGVHDLIGNIGGYIGLFLGKILFWMQ